MNKCKSMGSPMFYCTQDSIAVVFENCVMDGPMDGWTDRPMDGPMDIGS